MKITLLNSADFKSYSLSMLQALLSCNVCVDLIGNDDLRNSEIMTNKQVNFLNLRGNQNPDASWADKVFRILKFYFRLLKYASTTDSPLFHMQSHNKLVVFDRIFLNLYYKLLNKKLVFTAHNIDARQRDGRNNLINKISLKILYRLMDHILVHTDKMKNQLVQEFAVPANKITIIPHGILNTVPVSALSKSQARSRLQLNECEKVLLFFGYIAPYKGLEYLLLALGQLKADGERIKLIIAGQVKNCPAYWRTVEGLINKLDLESSILKRVKYIPDHEVEVLFKGSDALILPYKFIFQSGVPFLSYSFGLPVIATDVGSLREVIIEGETGMVCRKEDSADLAETIRRYFDSRLYRNLEVSMENIKAYGNEKYSWDGIGATIHGVYKALL